MNRIIRSIDPYIFGGFVGSLFAGLITPYHIKLIASALDVRVITLGSLAGSLFPFLTGLAFENRRLVRRMYAQLPLIMTAEVALTAAAVLLYALDLSLYYLASMIVFGTFTSAVMYLLQILKQRRYRRGRAAFDRRYAMADAGGVPGRVPGGHVRPAAVQRSAGAAGPQPGTDRGGIPDLPALLPPRPAAGPPAGTPARPPACPRSSDARGIVDKRLSWRP